MIEWQQIETAPKDGTEVLLAEPGHYSGRVSGYHICSGQWRQHKGYVEGGYWDGGRWLIVLPVAWMPLPEPPA